MSRETFEAWAKEQGYEMYRQKSGSYFFKETHIAWQVWSAATASMQVERDQLAAENVHLREQIMCWARECDRIAYRHTNKITDSHQKECEDDLKNIKTPATDRFLAEQRALALDSLAGVAETMLIKFSNQLCASDMHEVVGWKMVMQQAQKAAAQLRNEVKL